MPEDHDIRPAEFSDQRGYSGEAVALVQECLDWFRYDPSDSSQNSKAFCQAFLESVVDIHASDFDTVLRQWNIVNSNDVGQVVLRLQNSGRASIDQPVSLADFDGHFDLDVAKPEVKPAPMYPTEEEWDLKADRIRFRYLWGVCLFSALGCFVIGIGDWKNAGIIPLSVGVIVLAGATTLHVIWYRTRRRSESAAESEPGIGSVRGSQRPLQ